MNQVYYTTSNSKFVPTLNIIYSPGNDGRIRILPVTAAVLVIPAGEPAPLPELAAGPCGRVGANTAYFGGCSETIPIRGMQKTNAPIPAVDWQMLRNALAGGAE